MQIGCTKNLQDELMITAEAPVQDDDFYSWTANFVKAGRRKMVVVVNDATRFSFVLFGLKAVDFKKLDKLIVNGIRESFRSIFVTEQTIEKYLDEAGEIKYTKTKSAAHVGGLTQPCQMAYYWQEYADQNQIYQSFMTNKCNDNLITLYQQKNYVKPSKEMTNVMKAKYGDDAISIVAAEISIKLDAGEHQVFRRIHVPLNGSFYGLHKIIQACFGWKGTHRYGFTIPLDDGYSEMEIIADDDEPLAIPESRVLGFDFEIQLAEYLKESNKIVYGYYGLGQEWEHEITINQIIENYAHTYPKCVMAVGDHVPEKCRGSYGYEQFIKVWENPYHEGYDSLMGWLDNQDYEILDVEKVNSKLRCL